MPVVDIIIVCNFRTLLKPLMIILILRQTRLKRGHNGLLPKAVKLGPVGVGICVNAWFCEYNDSPYISPSTLNQKK